MFVIKFVIILNQNQTKCFIGLTFIAALEGSLLAGSSFSLSSPSLVTNLEFNLKMFSINRRDRGYDSSLPLKFSLNKNVNCFNKL